ncbi:VCBS repeat-containing protein [Romboutsia sedimentorum]|uniref:VCBS repeat-containing protein n=1 Tax=Romboutsia sedimentorum TaxID=1368474 RepID=A0ABT7EB13_9FIRM|nr:VCBS repeat-containing protein [Romboutsia sedimentorum]MDK2564120.1 VCBS repeat-containing protein [Romboutsia sedimentorum]
MKLFKLITCASLIVLLTTGCSINSESPEELIKDKPICDENNEILYKGIKQLLPQNSSLILPSNSSEVGKINEVDLDGDGVKELVAFEKKENLSENKNEVGFVVLSKNKYGAYTDKGNILQSGDSIEYANFYDLNNDGYKEIILLIKDVNKTNMHIYSFKNDEIKKIYTLDPTWIKERENLLDLKIKIGYIDDDDKLDILLLHYDSKSSKVYTSLANFTKELQLIDSTEFEDVKGLNNLYITIGTISKEKIGDVTKEKKGVILDIPMIQDNNYMTQIIYVKDKKINKAFNYNDKNLTKPYYIPTEDIDDDNVVDIPIVKGSGNIYTQKTSAQISWYKWNGKEKEKSGLVFISQIYYNYQYNYKVFIPNNLANKIDVQQAPQNKGNEVLFKFYYYDVVSGESKNLFTISVINKKLIEDKKNSSTSNGILLKETDEYNFVLYQDDLQELKKLKINTEALRENFSLIY